MKTNEELNALKNEVEALNKKLAGITDEELEQVAGGVVKAPKFFSPLLRLLASESYDKIYNKDLLDQ